MTNQTRLAWWAVMDNASWCRLPASGSSHRGLTQLAKSTFEGTHQVVVCDFQFIRPCSVLGSRARKKHGEGKKGSKLGGVLTRSPIDMKPPGWGCMLVSDDTSTLARYLTKERIQNLAASALGEMLKQSCWDDPDVEPSRHEANVYSE